VAALVIAWGLFAGADAQRKAALCTLDVSRLGGATVSDGSATSVQIVRHALALRASQCRDWWGIEERDWPKPAKIAPQKNSAIQQQQQPHPPAPDGDALGIGEDPIKLAIEEAGLQYGQAFRKVAMAQAPTTLAGKAGNLAVAAGTGIIRSGFETYDAIFGESTFAEKSDFRKKIDLQAAMLGEQSLGNAMTEQIMRFAIALIGLLLLWRMTSTFWTKMRNDKAG